MADVRAMASVSVNDTFTLSKEKKLYGLISMPELNQKVLNGVKKFMDDNIGRYDNIPVVVLSRYNGMSASIRNVGADIQEVFRVKSGVVLLDMGIPQDSIASISLSALWDINRRMAEADDEFTLDMLTDELMYELKLGDIENEDDVISFTPYIDLSRCNMYAVIGANWEVGDVSLPGVKQINLTHINLFSGD